MLTTGCRSGEIAALQWQHINLEDKSAFIEAITTKNGEDRIVFFNQHVYEDLTAFRAILRSLKYKGEWVFPRLYRHNHLRTIMPGASAMTISGVYQMFTRRLVEAKIWHRKFHALRHSHAIHALQAGIPIHEVRDQLGHGDVSVTEHYLVGYEADRAMSYKRF